MEDSISRRLCRTILVWFLYLFAATIAAAAESGGPEAGDRRAWSNHPLRKIPLAYRHDGFSMYYEAVGPMTRASLLRDHVEPFRGSNVDILVWGLGPGSVFCYDTKVGQIFGAPLSDEEWKRMRDGDRRVYENVTGQADRDLVQDPNWWRRGQLRVPVSASWWRLGTNEIRLVYTGKRQEPAEELSIVWIDLFLRYQPPQ